MLSQEANCFLLIRIRGIRLRGWRLSALVMSPLFVPALHLVPFFLLIGIQKPADLLICRLVNVHHLRSPVVLRKR